MALVADNVCKIGFAVCAVPGTIVAPEAYEQYGQTYGWQVHEVADPADTAGSNVAPAPAPTAPAQ